MNLAVGINGDTPRTPAEVCLKVEELNLHFGQLQVLHNIKLVVRRGELRALIGPNGAGKTALLNCINGLYRASSGHIYLGDADITGLRADQVARLGVARSFQHMELFRHMTVLENLLLGRYRLMRGNLLTGALYWGPCQREEIAHRQKVEEVLDFMELGRYRSRLVADLPYGIQKLVSVARALAMEPKVLLLDEPGSGLTHEEKEDLVRFLLRIKHEIQPTIIWVEHDVHMVFELADMVTVLDHGTVIADGKPETVQADPEVARAYTGVG